MERSEIVMRDLENVYERGKTQSHTKYMKHITYCKYSLRLEK